MRRGYAALTILRKRMVGGHLRRVRERYAVLSEALTLKGFNFIRPPCRKRLCTARYDRYDRYDYFCHG